jgi:hypothetical protein
MMKLLLVALAACWMLPRVKPMKEPSLEKAPFELTLEVVQGTGLRAKLKNISAKPQTYLVDDLRQPAALALVTPDGQPYVPEDRRQTMKYDRTIHKGRYRELAPGSEVVVGEAAFQPVAEEPGLHELVWGPFHFAVHSGTHRIRATFESRLDSWEEAGKKGRMPLWKGKLTSNEVELKLPPARS